MKYCVFCAEELPDDANFCSRCGRPQNPAPQAAEPVKAEQAKNEPPRQAPPSKGKAKRKAAGKPANKKLVKPEPKTKAKPKRSEAKKPRSNPLAKFNEKRAIVYGYTARRTCVKRPCGFNNCTIFASKAASDPENYLTACMKIKKAMTAGIIEKLNSLDEDD